MVMISEGENMKKIDFLPLKGNNSYKGSFDNFDSMETFVELSILQGLKILQIFSIYHSFWVISQFMQFYP